jgi:AmmeMemoRadiSam system protein B
MIMGSARRPVVAGMFYDSDSDKLKKQLSGFFRKVKASSSCIGVVSPHAGFVYSGQTAAWAVASLKAAKTFVVLGPNHNTLGEQFSCLSSGAWETPLGKVSVNKGVARRLMEQCPFLAEDAAAHAMEHSIEVQLPFLQHKFGGQPGSGSGAGFDFVPISIMNMDYSDGFLQSCEKLGKAIGMLARSKPKGKAASIGIVASSDFSHYLPKKVADKKDGKAVERILKLDTKGLFKTLDSVDASVCGYGPITVLMSAARALGLKARLLHKSTSGDFIGDNKSIVAYYAIGFC